MQVFTSSTALEHFPGADHPDQPVRLATVLATLRANNLDLIEAQPAPLAALEAVHDAGYLARAAALSRAGGGELGTDTTLSPASWDATLAAAGASLAALHHAMDGNDHAFAAIRPPGHHALHHRAMGFCIVNHVAVLARDAIRRGADRVLVIDWDVHHGNGTQALVERDPAIRFVSMHQSPWYPGTGAVDERGVGNCFNLPLPPGLPSNSYVETLWRGISAATDNWRPDSILISAGYDGMLGDPLGGFTLGAADYATWIQRLRNAFPAVPTVGLMEGGYNPSLLAAGVLATVRALE